MTDLRRQYWDSSVFCSFLNQEENRYLVVQDLLKEAYGGRLEIVTTTFALVEVLKLSGHLPITEKDEAELKAFFEYPFIKFFIPDREVCERARYFVWRHGLKSKDALHMATAERASKTVQIHELFSWDEDFVKLDGKTPVSFPITRPYMRQLLLQLPSEDQAEGNEDLPTEDDSAH